MVGISLAQLCKGAQVLLTDLSEAQEIVERNIRQAGTIEESSLRFQELNWDAELPDDLQSSSTPINLVIAADCTYNPDSRYAFESYYKLVRPSADISTAQRSSTPSFA